MTDQLTEQQEETKTLGTDTRKEWHRLFKKLKKFAPVGVFLFIMIYMVNNWGFSALYTTPTTDDSGRRVQVVQATAPTVHYVPWGGRGLGLLEPVRIAPGATSPEAVQYAARSNGAPAQSVCWPRDPRLSIWSMDENGVWHEGVTIGAWRYRAMNPTDEPIVWAPQRRSGPSC